MHKLAAGHSIIIDSAGTHAYHVGEGADKRSAKTAEAKGYDLSRHQARKLDYADFFEFDYILCMDKSHYNHAQSLNMPNAKAKVEMFLESDVPDPYYGGQKGFEDVLYMIEQGCHHWLKKLKAV
jgi:protein-tyrosine phosphatase